MDKIIEKYSSATLNNLDKNNISKIIKFLQNEKCNFIEDLLEDYLDLFTIEYKIFVDKYNKLNEQYNKELLSLATEDMNILEEFFND